MNDVQPQAPTQRNVILVLLLALAAAAWAVLIWHNVFIRSDMTSPMSGLLQVSLFLAMWLIMMVAMMFPSVAPIIIAFHEVRVAEHQFDEALVATWVFVAAYLLIWTLAGVVAYLAVLALEVSGLRAEAGTAQIGGLIIMGAGLYQLTPLKEVCLAECRTPIATATWYGEKASAFRMGLLHGVYCVGCYWLLFAAFFPLGMNIVAMMVIAIIVLAEKILPWPTSVRYAVACMLVFYGALVIASPQLTFQGNYSGAIPIQLQMSSFETGIKVFFLR